MTETHLKNVVEAALLAAGKPLQITDLAQLFEEHARPDATALKATLDALASDYEGRGIEIKETATGFRVQVRKEFAPEISRLWPERPPRYSRALLETLALISYRQPITRAEIEAVRGVAVNPNIIKTLLERNWVRVVGTRDVPGRPELLGTTREFLDYFGLRSLDELPPLAELKVMTDPNLQLALSAATPAAATAVEGLTEGGAATETTEQASAASDTSASEASASEVSAPETSASQALASEASASEVSASELPAPEASASEAPSIQAETADQPITVALATESTEPEAVDLETVDLEAASEPQASEPVPAEAAGSEADDESAADVEAATDDESVADNDAAADDEPDADDNSDADDESAADEYLAHEVEAALVESEAEPSDGDDDDSNTNNALSPDDEADLKLAEEADDEENREGDSAELVASRQTFED